MKQKIKNKNKAKKGIISISAIYIAVAIILFAPAQKVIGAEKHEITSGIMIELTNKSRTAAGISTLTINEKLSSAANAKADDMFKNQYFNHDSPSGITPWFWIKRAGYKYAFAGENLAIDFLTAEGAHDAFMNSEGHKQNILNPKYAEIGIAAKQGMFEGRESIIIVELFAQPAKIKSVAAPAQPLQVQKPAENKIAAVKNIPAPIKKAINQNPETQNIPNDNSKNITPSEVAISPTKDVNTKEEQEETSIPEVDDKKITGENNQENIFKNYARKDFSPLAVYLLELNSNDVGKNNDEKNNSTQLQSGDMKATRINNEEYISSNDYDSGKVMLFAFSISAILNMVYLSSKNMK